MLVVVIVVVVVVVGFVGFDLISVRKNREIK